MSVFVDIFRAILGRPKVGPATPEELARFREQGYFIRESLFSGAELRRFQDAVESIHHDMVAAVDDGSAGEIQMVDDKRFQDISQSNVKWEWQDASRDIRSMEPFLHLHPDLSGLVDDPRLWRPVQGLIGAESLSLFTDKLNFKRPGGSPFPLHQDSPYFAFDCKHVDQLVSMQIYLDDANRDNGCLWIVPTSHLQGILPGVQNKGTLDRLYTDMDGLDLPEPVPIEVPAGSIIYFHAHVIHGSKGNRTDASRRAMVITYQPSGHPCWKTGQERPIQMGA